jgi:hypothetical protein
MGLRERLRGRKTSSPASANPFELPKVTYEEFASRSSAGYYLAQAVVNRGHRVLAELHEIPNASQADIMAMTETIRGIYNLGRELAEVDGTLNEGSHRELGRHLSDSSFYDDSYDNYSYRRDYAFGDDADEDDVFDDDPDAPDYHSAYGHYRSRKNALRELADNHESARRWVLENLPESDQGEFLRLIDRRIEMRAALVQAYIDFSGAAEEISQAVQRVRVIEAASKLNRDAGGQARPELEMENAAHVRELASTLNAGLEAAYRIALDKAPELSEIEEAPSPFALERGESSLDAGL